MAELGAFGPPPPLTPPRKGEGDTAAVPHPIPPPSGEGWGGGEREEHSYGR